MRKFNLLVLLCVALVTASCGSGNPKELIVGKWENTAKFGDKETKTTYEFTSDGKITGDATGLGEHKGTYTFIDNNTFERTWAGADGVKSTLKQKFKVSKDQLQLMDIEGNPTKYARVK